MAESKQQESKYATLMETNEAEMESWYYFIKYDGNEENLKNLQSQLEKVKFKTIDELSAFDLELNYLVSAQTAKDMTKIDMNAFSFHRKFDGKLKPIDFGFTDTDKNIKKIKKCNDVLGYGSIDEFISDEDIDPEDLRNPDDESKESESESDDEDSDDEDSDDDSDDEDSDEDSDDEDSDEDSYDEDSDEFSHYSDEDSCEKSEEESKEESKEQPKKIGKIPEALIKSELPKWAKARKKKTTKSLKKV